MSIEIKASEWYGIDGSTHENIREYGFAWQQHEDGTYTFCVRDPNDATLFSLHTRKTLTSASEFKKAFDWVEDWTRILSTTGMTEAEFFAQEFPQVMFDLLLYYGRDNVFGGCGAHEEVIITD